MFKESETAHRIAASGGGRTHNASAPLRHKRRRDNGGDEQRDEGDQPLPATARGS